MRRKHKHTYSVRTWDMDLQEYTPQAGLSLPWDGLSLWQLKQALCELRSMGYSAHRVRMGAGDWDSDSAVFVERDDADEMLEKRMKKVAREFNQLARRNRKCHKTT
jgi:hypothetical protein